MATFKEQIETLKKQLAEADQRAQQAYTNGLQAARDFDAEMDTFLVKFMRRDDSSVIVFAIALGLVLAGGVIGYAARGFL